MWLPSDMHIVAWPLLMGALAELAGFRFVSLGLAAHNSSRGARFRNVLRRVPQFSLVALHICVATIVCYGVTAFWRPGYTEWVENAVMFSAKRWAGGGPIYPDPTNIARFNVLPYGPLLFQMLGSVKSWTHGSDMAVKALPASLTLLTWLAMIATLRRSAVTLARSIVAVELLAIVVGIMGFMAKADTLLIFLAALSCAIVTFGRGRWAGGVLLAIAAGLATGVKLHGALYILPAAVEFLALSSGRRSWRAVIGATIAVIVAAAPFLLPGSSPGGYIATLRAAAQDGLLLGIFFSNIAFIGMFAICIHALTGARERDRTYYRTITAVLGAGAVVSIFAAKAEAGPHHLIPLLPYLCLLLGRALQAAHSQDAPAYRTRCYGLLVLFLLGFQPVTAVIGDLRHMVAAWNTHEPVL